MYHALLTNRYLTSRVIPLIAVAAVALCVALVIIVVSVMTGFLDMVRASGRTLMGDVIIAYPVSGIPYYERLIDRLKELPGASAATPVVDSWGLLKMPYPDGLNKETETVQVWGIEPESFAKVTGYGDTLYWRPHTTDELAEMLDDDPRRLLNESLPGETTTAAERLYADALSLDDSRTSRPGIVLGLHVSVGNVRQSDGSIRPMNEGYWWMPRHEVILTMLPVDTEGGLQAPESYSFPVVNEFFSGVFLIDDKRVMVPLDIAQNRLHLDGGDILDPEQIDEATGLPVVIGVDPPKATLVLVRAADGVSPDELLAQIEPAYDAFRDELMTDDTALVKPPLRAMGLSIKTWEQQQAQFIEPIEKERELMRTLFSLVYLVCAGLVLSIFWAIVYEKTRDIGILRFAWTVVRNINAIHSAMGEPPITLAVVTGVTAGLALIATVVRGRTGRLLPIVLGTLITVTLAAIGGLIVWVERAGGIVIWDPSVYYFSVIPNEVDMVSAGFTMVGAVVFSLIGAFLPAAKAADTDPVKALRYE
ncbi:MAG: ABC transporter permease [Planctomycetota bacterium]|jgi:lipoprotein-releasing system permease protein